MSRNLSDWVAEKLVEDKDIKIMDRVREDFFTVRWKDKYTFTMALLGVQDVIRLEEVKPFFSGATEPKLVVNVPSKTLWSGDAIRHIHSASAAFGVLGDVSRAAATGNVGSFRDKKMGFFINAMEQHSNVSSVSYVYDRLFSVEREKGPGITVAVIDAYNMSAEDVRNARTQLGHFDILVKSTSYGAVTHQAVAAAKSIGAEALTFGELMGRLNK